MITIETRYLIISCRSKESAQDLAYKVTDGISAVRLFKVLMTSSYAMVGDNDSKIERHIMKQTDLLYERVLEHLGLGVAKRLGKTKLELYDNRDQLQKQHDYLYGKSEKEITNAAWYVFQLNTIFANLDRLTEGVLAHEIAHAAIGNYLNFKLPRGASEILARYVDKHLYSNIKEYTEWG